MQDENGIILDRREMLKVKVKSLAEEARIIRREERRMRGGTLRDELRQHRVGIVRWHARHAHIAYGLIKGRSLEQIERSALVAPDWKEIRRQLAKYGPQRDWDVPGAELKKAA